MKNIVSFGGGVQSTALAIMVMQERLPKPDLWLFADTGDEPARVYTHVEKWMDRFNRWGWPFEVVHRFDDFTPLSDHVVTKVQSGKGSFNPPFFVEREDGKACPVRRKCTYEYKMRPLDKRAKEFAEGERVRKWVGISYDERQRERISDKPWFDFYYPLIELRLNRSDCQKIISDFGETAPRSACVFCPFHSDDEWRNIKKNDADWDRAVGFEKEIHRLYDAGFTQGLKSKPYLHPSRVPLHKINWTNNQRTLFSSMDQECFGLCGV